MKNWGKGLSLLALVFIVASVPKPGQNREVEPLEAQSKNGLRQEPEIPEPPSLSTRERYRMAFPYAKVGLPRFLNQMVYDDVQEWPHMRYLGDSMEIEDRTFTILDAKIVPGRNVPMAYEPATGRFRQAPRGFFTKSVNVASNTEIFIPPGASLVMVKVDVEPEWGHKGENGLLVCEDDQNPTMLHQLRVAYPGLGETLVLQTSLNLHHFGEFSPTSIVCMGDGWLYFHVATQDVDPTRLWFIYADVERIPWAEFTEFAVWTLAQRP